MRYLFLIIVFISMLVISACNDKQENISQINYPDVNIYYGKKGEIWVYNSKTQAKRKILDNAFGPFLSPDKTKLAYWVPHNDIKPEQDDVDTTSYHIYDIKTGGSSILLERGLTYPNFGYEQWSPDSRYIIFDSGSSPTRGKYIVDTITKKEIAEFVAVGGDFLWLNNNEILFNEGEDIVVGEYVKTISKIASINIISGKQNIIFSSDDYETKYYFLAIVGDKILLGSHGKGDEERYWLINKDGSVKIQVEKDKYESYDEKNQKDVSELEAKVRSLLPEPYNKYQYFWITQGKDKWVIIQTTQNINDNNNDIFIINIDNPQSLRKIDNGDSATW